MTSGQALFELRDAQTAIEVSQTLGLPLPTADTVATEATNQKELPNAQPISSVFYDRKVVSLARRFLLIFDDAGGFCL
jgi:hypothetical protein